MKTAFSAILVCAAVLASAKGQTITNSHGVVIYTNHPLGAWLARLSEQEATNSPPPMAPGVSTAPVETSRLPAATAPCKTPQELLAAVRAALQAQDTNALWKLHCWTKVSPREEAWHKHADFCDHFKQLPGDQFTYSSFRLKGVQPGFNAPRPGKVRSDLLAAASPGARTNTLRPALVSGVHQYNIPVTGVLTFTIKSSSPSQYDNKPIRSSSESGLYFGQGPDGNFWLAVETFIPKAEPAPSQQ